MKETRWDGPWSGHDCQYWQLRGASPVWANLYKKSKRANDTGGWHQMKPFKQQWYLNSNIGCLNIDADSVQGAKQKALAYLRKQVRQAMVGIESKA